MSTFGVDYAFGPHPSVSALKAATIKRGDESGPIEFVMRYIGSKVYDSSRSEKWLNHAEATQLLNAGFTIGLFFETGAKRAEGGHAAGVADAKVIAKELAYCVLPADMPVLSAVDYDTVVGPNITGYFTALSEARGVAATGVYGGIKVVDALFEKKLVTYGCQTLAWSGGKWSSHAQTQQFTGSKTLGGADVDYQQAMAVDFGQYPRPTPPAPKPPTPLKWPGRYLKLASPMMHGSDVRYVQQRLGAHHHAVTVDGYYGTKTRDAVRAFQRGAKLTVDGVVGPKTWQALAKP